jgi:hypothetical protein
MRPVHPLHLHQPNDRFRHRRNLRQLPQVMCLAMQPGSTLSLWEQPEARGSR